MSERYPEFSDHDSVTEVIHDAGLIPEAEFIDPWFLGRGSAIHLATALYDKGTLDEDSVAPEIRGALDSWKRYREIYTPTHVELKLNDPVYKLCGTIDRLPLLDIKGPNKAKFHVVQLGGYWHLCKVNKFELYCDNPHTVHLDPDGGMPKIQPYSIKEMITASRELLTLLAANRIRKNYRGKP